MVTNPIPRVGVIMGSRSDWETMQEACAMLDHFGIHYERRVVSAHRTPQWMIQYATTAAERGLQVLIAGAGGAAHLPGMVASCTSLPVLGVPVQSRAPLERRTQEFSPPESWRWVTRHCDPRWNSSRRIRPRR